MDSVFDAPVYLDELIGFMLDLCCGARSVLLEAHADLWAARGFG